ncbi:unnamed protein product [Polarella glacialis]|uniref:U-box domain-containing protein n=1 Tax=Polarella glacialis TaxID=89957 RepID=A0A813FG47_POLGL|nr:unnamed protein product [Polarella glacialis]
MGHTELVDVMGQSLETSLFVGPGATFRRGDSKTLQKLAPRVLALCGVNAPAHQEDVEVKAAIKDGTVPGESIEASCKVPSGCKVEDLLVKLAREGHLNPLELVIRPPGGTRLEDPAPCTVSDLLAQNGLTRMLERNDEGELVLQLTIHVNKSTRTHVDFYTAGCRLSQCTKVQDLPAGEKLYVSFRRTETLRHRQIHHQGVQSIFGACMSWHPFGVMQSSEGMSIFLSTLFAISGSRGIERTRRSEMLGHFRSVVRFPPAVWALQVLLSQATTQISDADKNLIATSVYFILRQQAPASIPNNKLFEHSRVFFAFLIGYRQELDAQSEKFVMIPASGDSRDNSAQLTPGRGHMQQDDSDTENNERPQAAEASGLDMSSMAALYSPGFPFADEFTLWLDAAETPQMRYFLHPWNDLVDALADCKELRILTPLALQRSQPVQITRDEDGTTVAYVGMPGSGAGQVALFCPLLRSEVERDVQDLARKVAALNFGDMADDSENSAKAAVKEAIVVCLDCSQSMAGTSGFSLANTEDSGVQSARLRRAAGFDERSPDPDTPEALAQAISHFATSQCIDDLRQIVSDTTQPPRPGQAPEQLPGAPGVRARGKQPGRQAEESAQSSAFAAAAMQVLADWCRLQYDMDKLDENNDLRLISKYPERFVEVLRSPAVAQNTTGIPHELQCPITYALMEDPVIADDGFIYERSAIEAWLLSSPCSPMTREALARPPRLTQNMAVRSMAQEWQSAAVQPSPESFQIFVRGLPSATRPPQRQPRGLPPSVVQGQLQSFYVLPSTTVAALLQRIQSRLGMPGYAQMSRLQFQSRTLRPVQTMQEAEVQSGRTLELTCSLQSWTACSIGAPVMVVVSEKRGARHFGNNLPMNVPILMHSKDTVLTLLVRLWRYGRRLPSWAPASRLRLWHGLKDAGDSWLTGCLLERTKRLEEYGHLFESILAPMESNHRQPMHRLTLELDNQGQAKGGPQAISRMDAVKAMFYSFRNRLQAYSSPIELGLVTFSSTATTACAITPLLENFIQKVDRIHPDGNTALYDAVGMSVDMLEAWRRQKKNPSLALRVVCLSDGQDLLTLSTACARTA